MDLISIDIDVEEYQTGYSDQHIDIKDTKIASLLQCGICYLILRDPHHLVSTMSFNRLFRF